MMALALEQGAEDTYPHPQGLFNATNETIRSYIRDGDDGLRVRKNERYWERRIAQSRGNGAMKVVAIRETDEAIAFSEVVYDEEHGFCELDALYGLRDYRRQPDYQIGSMLMRAVLHDAEGRGCTVHAATTAWNPALEFYVKRCGAIIIQRDADLPKADTLTVRDIDLHQTAFIVFSRDELCMPGFYRAEKMQQLYLMYPPRLDRVSLEDLLGTSAALV